MMSVSRILIVDRLRAELLQFRGYDRNLEWSAHAWLDQVYLLNQQSSEKGAKLVLVLHLLLWVKGFPGLLYAVAEGGIFQLVHLEACSRAYRLDDESLYRRGA